MALDLFNILSESDTDLRQPVGLEDQLLQARSIDSEVGQSMLQLLQVCHCALLISNPQLLACISRLLTDVTHVHTNKTLQNILRQPACDNCTILAAMK